MTRRIITIILAMLLAACVTTGTEPARDMTDRMAYTQAGVTAARQVAADMLGRQRISADRAKSLQFQADEATDALKTARLAFGAGKTGDAAEAMQAAIVILTAINTPRRDAMEAANVALDLLMATQRAQAAGSVVSQLIAQAKAEKRSLSKVEWDAIDSADTAAREQLATLIRGG